MQVHIQNKPVEKKQCHYCANNVKEVTYKDAVLLRKFVSSYFKIAPRRRSGLCAQHQRKVAQAIKQARVAGLMPFCPK
ncbi:MAG: 30S ribosomal protein S18 [Candidatus Magasanikbacteria bacterium RIFCSPLOWO2_01_FULL_43_20b]|uniref:Small ribosomal subunit protein bS18 n=1 Tax=Candidatus Magasanikbacteria bacterium RIFCSPLOWO2_12_FULL_43_12 TaxID=1798692 RepID=A0A1F6MRI7_9BACT|nr:MAG: 30S ribosomal protein S18 [Candidatus Magasanikbacteria bacterium RIFCSPHIGHO2_02_FULL_44_13]OGH72685.1 MAG: 30S ribosomal protein S18 [Candidatus Magasanikbacteria bacterium RIFCSPLOWO2_02_FULL_43_22]OGH72985.1 MAG: 30S ribosomal protein S18 [Candidatus Magasanikbacteria bacterium RIFCSPLOWO2_01_FULL_43_20b]OGH74168.1 MAG: 30S ribosomal protein S18 [Candidatus Magasanikbacteria bacterium RIFCSPLOWO2_12_FULL_43_12]